MKQNTKIDRGTLLKGGGTLALTTLLAAALDARAEASVYCCDPIDLYYEDSPSPQRPGNIAKMSDRAPTSIGGLWLVTRKKGQTKPPRRTGWKCIYLIPKAQAKGRDEWRNGHGKGQGVSTLQPLGYDIWVYVKT